MGGRVSVSGSLVEWLGSTVDVEADCGWFKSQESSQED
jgi:hypothetical protein